MPKNPNKLRTLHLEENPLSDCGCSVFSLVAAGTSVYISWKNVRRMDTCLHRKSTNFITNSTVEAILLESNQNVTIHCNDQSFKNLVEFSNVKSQISNNFDMLSLFGQKMTKIDLSGNFGEKPNDKILRNFINLERFALTDTNLIEFDFNALRYVRKLKKLDFSDNNFQRIFNIDTLKLLTSLTFFSIKGSKLKNMDEIFQCLSPSIEHLWLHGNVVGTLQSLYKFPHLVDISLHNTSLKIPYIDPFVPVQITLEQCKLFRLDISSNNLQEFNFTDLSTTLKCLKILDISCCNIKNMSELIEFIGPSIVTLNLSGNFMNHLEANTLHKFSNLSHLLLTQMNLSQIDSEALINQHELRTLRLSRNKLSTLNFTCLPGKLELLDLYDNELTSLDGLNSMRFPNLTVLNISKNRFSREYLADFLARAKIEWPHMNLTYSNSENGNGLIENPNIDLYVILIGMLAFYIGFTIYGIF